MEEWIAYDWKRGLAGRAGQVLHKSSFICAFCRGTGVVGPAKKAKCQVCGGKGTITAEPPVIVCAYCQGRGMKVPRSYILCTVCKGKGIVPIKEPIEKCKRCRGRGKAGSSNLPCLTCHGKGSVTVENPKS